MITEPNLVTDAVATDEEQARLGLFIENIRLPAALVPRLRIPVLHIADLADAYGLQLGDAVERVSATSASGDIAKALKVDEGMLVVMLDRIVHLRDGQPAEWRIAYCLDLGIWRD